MMQVKQISDNEIYLLIKSIKSVLWRVAKCLSYTEEARCLKVKYLTLLELCKCNELTLQCTTVLGPVVDVQFHHQPPPPFIAP